MQQIVWGNDSVQHVWSQRLGNTTELQQFAWPCHLPPSRQSPEPEPGAAAKLLSAKPAAEHLWPSAPPLSNQSAWCENPSRRLLRANSAGRPCPPLRSSLIPISLPGEAAVYQLRVCTITSFYFFSQRLCPTCCCV